MLFSIRKLLTMWECIKSKSDSMEPIRESLLFDIECSSSASEGLKIAGSESLEG